MENEIWKPIHGYEGIYSVSCHGRIRLEKRTRQKLAGDIIKPIPMQKTGYFYVNLFNGRSKKLVSVARIIASAFIGHPCSGQQVNHKNGVKTDNHIDNLEWVTPRENSLHAFRAGLRNPPRGENSGNAKLTNEQVKTIRAAYLSGGMSQRAIADKHGVSRSLVGFIVTKKRWRHIV